MIVTFMLHMSQINYNIVESLMKSNNHVRGLAKLLNSNQTTIARKLKELLKANIVDYREEGRNKVFFLKKNLESKQFIYSLENNKLLEILKKYPSLRTIIENIKENKKIRLAILFGSYAKGLATKNSDIDIYIDTKDKKIKEQVGDINSKINVKIGLYNQDSLLIKEIDKNHVIIKGVELYYEKNKFFS